MPIVEAIEEAKAVYSAAGLNYAEGLLPPASDEDISLIISMIAEEVEGYGLASQAPKSIPPELRALYRVHGG